jgi:predicted component of type VI protein secretion system
LIEQSFADTVKERPLYYDGILRDVSELKDAIARLEKAAGYAFDSYDVPLAPLKKNLAEFEAALSVFGGPLPDADSALAIDPAPAPGILRQAGGLATREDVVHQLGRIIQFYQKFEPTSPVPIMLERAQRVATMDFKEIVKEFNLSGSPSIQDVLGWKSDF